MTPHEVQGEKSVLQSSWINMLFIAILFRQSKRVGIFDSSHVIFSRECGILNLVCITGTTVVLCSCIISFVVCVLSQYRVRVCVLEVFIVPLGATV